MIRDAIYDAVLSAADYLRAWGFELPDDVLADLDACKTQAYYDRALNRGVLDFYRGDIDGGEFIDKMIGLIEEQFKRAWNEGARDVGFNPKDMTDDDLLILMERVEAEKEYILGFAGDIEAARLNQTPVEPLQARVDLWTNRYNEIVNEARIHFGGKKKLKWKFGDTIEHCADCSKLDGVVALAEDWEASGYKPQSPDLECGGWRCQCTLEPTDEDLTEGGIP